mmetsp:Transcript_23499/g.41649  ORF Transcript_23499/g.41649 Transcript_23499/m.41649 type:complete len:106 (-) Transcript_23499:524-841(-)
MYRDRRKKKSCVWTIDDEVKHLESFVVTPPTEFLRMKAERAIFLLQQRGQETKLKFIEHPFPRDKYDKCFDENEKLVKCLKATGEYLHVCRGLLTIYQECKAQPR